MAQSPDVRLVTETKLTETVGALPGQITELQDQGAAHTNELTLHQGRIEDLEVLGGLTPGSINDTTMRSIAEDPESEFSASLSAAIAGQTVDYLTVAKNPDLLVSGNIVRDVNDVIDSADVLWPDGTLGTFTTLEKHATGAISSYSITYGAPATRTFTQPTITRNAAGAATLVPQIVEA